MELNVVLVEPEIPQNTGNIARTCAAAGAALHLVGPLGFSLDEKHLKRAGLDYWKFVTVCYYENMQAFMKLHANENLYLFSAKASLTYTDVSYKEGPVWLVFGKESVGLPEELLLEHPQRSLRIPMAEGIRSLNLSNSAAVALYEVLRQREFPNLQKKGRLAYARMP